MRRVISIVVSMVLLFCSTVAVFASESQESWLQTLENPKSRIETALINGEMCKITIFSTEKSTDVKIFGENGEVLARSIHYIENGDVLIMQKGIDSHGYSRAKKVNYKKQYTHKGEFKPVSWTTVAVTAYILSLNPAAGTAVVTSLAAYIIQEGVHDMYYTVDVYTASDKDYFYQKNVFKVYNKETRKQIGNTITTETKTRQK